MFVRFTGALSTIRGAGCATELQRENAMTASLYLTGPEQHTHICNVHFSLSELVRQITKLPERKKQMREFIFPFYTSIFTLFQI